jgi:peptidyl-tRNA hydrolase
MDRARQIFARSMRLARKDVIRKFIKDAGLTQKGATTYYYSISREWLAKNGRKLTKADRARTFLGRMKRASRMDAIQVLVDRVGLTRAGASTYYHRYKSGA